MPLRDHFRAPTATIASWEDFRGGWPMVIAKQLNELLPPGYRSGPHVHLGAQVEIDVAAYDENDDRVATRDPNCNGNTSTALWAPPAPMVVIETEFPVDDEYEVRIYDASRRRNLVAAVEIVSPSNRDRPEKRNSFVSKCAALLRKGVAVSIVDLVTVRRFNLYAELMQFIGHPDPTLGAEPPHTYAAACRWLATSDDRGRIEMWSNALVVGQALPTLPLWLTETSSVPLDLERSYEQACKDLRIP
jgi:hypothetical protein